MILCILKTPFFYWYSMVKYDLPAIMNQQGCQQQPLRIFAENCPRLATTLEPTAVAGVWEKHGLVKYRYGHLMSCVKNYMQVIWKNPRYPRYPRSNGFNDSAGRIYVILCPYFWPYSIFRHLYQCIEDIKILPHQLGIKHATLNEGSMQSLARDIILSLPQKTCCTTLYHVVPSGNFT